MRLAVAVSCSIAAAFVFCVAICLISARWRRQHFARQSGEADAKQAAAYKVAEPQHRGALGLQHLPVAPLDYSGRWHERVHGQVRHSVHHSWHRRRTTLTSLRMAQMLAAPVDAAGICIYHSPDLIAAGSHLFPGSVHVQCMAHCQFVCVYSVAGNALFGWGGLERESSGVDVNGSSDS